MGYFQILKAVFASHSEWSRPDCNQTMSHQNWLVNGSPCYPPYCYCYCYLLWLFVICYCYWLRPFLFIELKRDSFTGLLVRHHKSPRHWRSFLAVSLLFRCIWRRFDECKSSAGPVRGRIENGAGRWRHSQWTMTTSSTSTVFSLLCVNEPIGTRKWLTDVKPTLVTSSMGLDDFAASTANNGTISYWLVLHSLMSGLIESRNGMSQCLLIAI